MKKLFLFLVALSLAGAGGAGVTGCVSKKTYQTALDESAHRGIRIEEVLKDLEEQKDINKTIFRDLRDSETSRQREATELNERIADLNGRIEELQGVKKALEGSESEKARKIGDLVKKLEESQDEATRLSRELESLRAQAEAIKAEKEEELSRVRGTYDSLVKELENEIERGEIKITQAMDRLSVNLVEKILFDSGRAEIKPEGKEVLERVGNILKEITDKQIRVEGHTDDVPIGPRIAHRFPTNWELSTARATTVVRYLQDTVGLDPVALTAAGYSLYRPVATNEDEEGRAQNRRIEIVLLPLDVDTVLEELKK